MTTRTSPSDQPRRGSSRWVRPAVAATFLSLVMAYVASPLFISPMLWGLVSVATWLVTFGFAAILVGNRKEP